MTEEEKLINEQLAKAAQQQKAEEEKNAVEQSAASEGGEAPAPETPTAPAAESRFPTTKRRRTALQRQRRAVLISLCVVAVLAIAFTVVSIFTSRIVFTDVDGTKYYIRQRKVTVESNSGDFVEKRWVMEDTDGNRLERDENLNYITAIGTRVMVDYDTGDYQIVSVYMPDDGEDKDFDYQYGQYDVLVYPELKAAGITSIEIFNKNGTFTFVSDGEGGFEIKGHEGLPYLSSVMIDTLVNLTGYTKALMKIELSDAFATDKDGNYLDPDLENFRNNGYAEYGLSEKPEHAEIDEYYYDGYFIIKGTDVNGNTVEHKVLIGNQILTDTGFYVRYVGRDDVYILKQLEESDYISTFSATLLGKMEDYVTPMVTTPMSTNTYFDVSDFTISKYNKELGAFEDVVEFSYVPIQLRQGKFDSSMPYQVPENSPLGGYNINSYNADDCLQSIQSIVPLQTVKLYSEYPGENDDPDMNVKRFIAEYCDGMAAYALGFTYHSARNEVTYETLEDKSYPNQIWISEMTERSTYYMFNAEFNMVVECSVEYLDFLSWERMQWIEPEIFSGNIAYLEKVEILLPTGIPSLNQVSSVVLNFDNSASELPSEENNYQQDSSKLVITADYADQLGISVNVTQFRQFYKTLLFSSLVGTMPEGTEELQESLRASGNSGASLVIRMTYNRDGETLVRTYRFYSKTAGNLGAFTTLDGNGSFYMKQSRVDKIISDISKIFTPEVAIDPEGKF